MSLVACRYNLGVVQGQSAVLADLLVSGERQRTTNNSRRKGRRNDEMDAAQSVVAWKWRTDGALWDVSP